MKDKDSIKDKEPETLEELCERLGIKMLPEDHPIYKEPPSVIFKSFPSKASKKDEDDEGKNTK